MSSVSRMAGIDASVAIVDEVLDATGTFDAFYRSRITDLAGRVARLDEDAATAAAEDRPAGVVAGFRREAAILATVIHVYAAKLREHTEHPRLAAPVRPEHPVEVNEPVKPATKPAAN